MNAWSHLPNAAHIDLIIESVKSHPEAWAEAWNAAWSTSTAPRDVARSAAQDAAYNSAPRNAARIAAWGAARIAAWDASRIPTRAAARDAVLSLIAYDAAAKYLDMTSDKLQVWAILSEDPAAVLLLPAVIAYEKINELETV